MKFVHIGWCKEGIHDKVWGIILLAEDVQVSPAWPFKTNKYVTFWGRRGSKLQTKLVTLKLTIIMVVSDLSECGTLR